MTSIRTSSILKRGVAVGASKERQQLGSDGKGVNNNVAGEQPLTTTLLHEREHQNGCG